MKKFLIIIFSAIVLLLHASCNKEEILITQAEATTKELQNIIAIKKPERVIAVIYGETFPNSFSSVVGVSHSFSNGFISIAGYSRVFNLTYLKSYDIANVVINDGIGNPTVTSSALILYFE